MAATTTQTGMLSKLGTKLTTAHTKFKGAPVEIGQMGLPAGIENGVARLTECKIGVYKEGDNTGQPFFYASGNVLAPKEVNGTTVLGGLTKIGPEPLCDTPNASGKRKTFDDHYKWFRDHLAALGFDIDKLTGTPQQIEAGILAGMQALKGNPKDPATWIYFKFRTWKGAKQTTGPYAGKEPMVQHTWGESCEWNGEADPTAVNSSGVNEAPAPEFNEFQNGAGAAEAGNDTANDVDLDDLAARADPPTSEQEAQEALDKMADDLGISEAAGDASSYSEVVSLIREAQAAAGDGGTAEANAPDPEPEFEAEKGVVYKLEVYKDAKNKKKGKKQIEVETKTVDKAKKTVTAIDCTTKKLITGDDGKTRQIPWAELIVG